MMVNFQLQHHNTFGVENAFIKDMSFDFYRNGFIDEKLHIVYQVMKKVLSFIFSHLVYMHLI